MEKKNKNLVYGVSVIFALILLVGSAAFISFKMASERARNQKWKDYDDCGLW